MNVIKFVVTYWDSIVVVLSVIAAVLLMLRKGMKAQVFEILKYLVTIAEEEYGSGTGALKKQAVIAEIYERMPSILKYFLTEKAISDMIESAWQWMVDLIEENASVKEALTGETTSEESTE